MYRSLSQIFQIDGHVLVAIRLFGSSFVIQVIQIIIQHFDLRQIDRDGGTISIDISSILNATHGNHPTVWMESGNPGTA